MWPGSMSMPTETKKIAANMSRTGWMRRSTCFSAPDSAEEEHGDEGPERHRVAELQRQQRAGEADADAGDEQGFGAMQPAHRADEPRHQQEADHDEAEEKRRQPAGRTRQGGRGEVA